MTLSRLDRYHKTGTPPAWRSGTRTTYGGSSMPMFVGMMGVLDEQFAGGALNGSRWYAYDQSTFGAPSRIQRYMAYNAAVGAGSTGSTGGTSLRLKTKRENVGGQAFTAGMVDSKTAGYFLPLYGRVEHRAKYPHGHGLWPAFWLTARNGGAAMAEFDQVEVFHQQRPGRYWITFHSQTSSTSGTVTNRFTNNSPARTFLEAPTLTPAWHTFATDIVPVTDASGSTLASPTAPSQYVRFTNYLDGVEVFRFVDTQALYWTTNISADLSAAWNVYVQGCQVDGPYQVGHPDDPLGYDHVTGTCATGSGTAPSSCATSAGGYNVFRAGIGPAGTGSATAGPAVINGQDAVTLEVDYIRAWRFTG
jgi:hypothetical protein